MQETPKPPKPRLPVWLIIVYILSLLSILAWPLIAFMSVFAFDAPGTAQDPAVWTGVIAVLSYPVLPLVGDIASFFLYRGNRKVLAYILAGIGAIPATLLIVIIVAVFVENARLTPPGHFPLVPFGT